MTYSGYRFCTEVKAQKKVMKTGIWPIMGANELSGLTFALAITSIESRCCLAASTDVFEDML